jgi:hypothetical protein
MAVTLKGDGGQIELQNGNYVDVARRKKEEFLKAIGHWYFCFITCTHAAFLYASCKLTQRPVYYNKASF